MKGKRYAVALGIALVIGAFLGGYISGNRSANATNKVAKGEEAIPAQTEANEAAKMIGGRDVAAEFRERHNRALSPEAREDNRRKLREENFPWMETYLRSRRPIQTGHEYVRRRASLPSEKLL